MLRPEMLETAAKAEPSAARDGGERHTLAARLVVEDAGPPVRSPIAWQGGALSQLLAELAASART